ncbi:substrate-binding domain-containing protein [Paraburkholderia susongensis]|uniref:Amino acid ABC transporter substrate-binding protein, PAAT family n=1 Tax=Paraburkholderia susongensis TaxID=1515439 RepID=A0A1X7M0Z2_9BURK|nr:substrate-binding domain-containing protein [Paraburkholderia susongensis]SMG59838.1 amino acid ABC transporter substrate-binding protein, PAAT family [Paraburkholderia susongensis]
MRHKRSVSAQVTIIAGALCCAALASAAVRADGPALPNNDGADGVLRVCADPNNMPLSNNKGEGYENRIASQMASDFGYKLEYTYFPQRMGFVRHTLREKEEGSERYKCDLIIGVPKGYDMTSTTQPYLRSTYAMVVPNRPEFASIKTPDDLLKLPPDVLHKLRFGIFTQTPAVDWLLAHNLIDQAVSYRVQSGDPAEYPGQMIEQDLHAGNVDVVFLWGPIAGYFAKRGGDSVRLVPFPAGPGIRFDYTISMGVRYGEKAWKDKVDQWIGANHDKIDSILATYQVPMLKPVDAPGPKAADASQ